MKLRWCFGRWGNTQNQKQTSHTFWQLIRYVNESRYKSRTVIVVADSAQAKEEASPSPSRAAPVHYTIVGIEYQKQITRALGRNEKTCEEKEDQEKKRNKKVTFFASWRKNRQQQPAGEDKLKRVTQRHLPPGTIIQVIPELVRFEGWPGNTFSAGGHNGERKSDSREEGHIWFSVDGAFFFLFSLIRILPTAADILATLCKWGGAAYGFRNRGPVPAWRQKVKLFLLSCGGGERKRGSSRWDEENEAGGGDDDDGKKEKKLQSLEIFNTSSDLPLERLSS